MPTSIPKTAYVKTIVKDIQKSEARVGDIPQILLEAAMKMEGWEPQRGNTMYVSHLKGWLGFSEDRRFCSSRLDQVAAAGYCMSLNRHLNDFFGTSYGLRVFCCYSCIFCNTKLGFCFW